MPTPNPHILLLGPLPPPYGGVSVHLFRLRRRLKEVGLHSTTLTRGGISNLDESTIAETGRWNYWRRFVKLAQNATVVHDHTQHYQARSPILNALFYTALRSVRSKKVLTVHDGTFTDHLRNANGVQRRFIRAFIQQFDAILVISEELATTVGSLGVPPDRIHFVKTFLFDPPAAIDLTKDVERFLHAHSPVWLVSGAYHETYHYDVVAEAFCEHRKTNVSAGLIFVSGGFATDNALRSRVESALEPHRSHALDLMDISPETLRMLYDRANVFIRSAYPDGDGVSLREAVLGTCAVVAAENHERPFGVICYSPNDSMDLLKQIEAALRRSDSNDREAMRSQTRSMAEENYRNIVRAYGLNAEQQLSKPEPSHK
jgi:glycogen(starch) synthase